MSEEDCACLLLFLYLFLNIEANKFQFCAPAALFWWYCEAVSGVLLVRALDCCWSRIQLSSDNSNAETAQCDSALLLLNYSRHSKCMLSFLHILVTARWSGKYSGRPVFNHSLTLCFLKILLLKVEVTSLLIINLNLALLTMNNINYLQFWSSILLKYRNIKPRFMFIAFFSSDEA